MTFRGFLICFLMVFCESLTAETRVIVDYSKKTAQGLLRSRGPFPKLESDFDGFRLFEGLGIESKISGGTQLKSFVSSDGTFSIDCTVITNLRHGICNFLLKDGVGATFDKEIDGAVWKPVGKIASEVRRLFDSNSTGREFVFVDSTQSVAFYSSKDETVLKIKSK